MASSVRLILLQGTGSMHSPELEKNSEQFLVSRIISVARSDPRVDLCEVSMAS